MSELYKKVYSLVKQIPKGMVTTYGILALMTGNPRRSRIIGSAMSKCNDNNVPCHRVIRKDGSLSDTFGIMGNSYQRILLEEEGITFLPDGRVDLSRHLWTY